MRISDSEGKKIGGRGGIRTHGGLPHARFRVECLKPDSATLPKGEETSDAQNPTSNVECKVHFGTGRWALRFALLPTTITEVCLTHDSSGS
jgi:hypothetical protein